MNNNELIVPSCNSCIHYKVCNKRQSVESISKNINESIHIGAEGISIEVKCQDYKVNIPTFRGIDILKGKDNKF